MCSDVSSVDILVEENDGGLCAAVQELDVEYLQLFHSEYNKKNLTLFDHFATKLKKPKVNKHRKKKTMEESFEILIALIDLIL